VKPSLEHLEEALERALADKKAAALRGDAEAMLHAQERIRLYRSYLRDTAGQDVTAETQLPRSTEKDGGR
jgi:hypothetical protein